jgi:MFS transporter, DHA1 family, inner membrane transport protein
MSSQFSGRGIEPTTHGRASDQAEALPEWLAILMASGTFFSIVVMNYIIAPILPTLAGQFGIGVGQAGLLVTVYSVLFAFAALLLGSLGDRFGTRRVIVVALVIFALTTLLTGLATSFTAMVALRGVAGLAAAAVMPANWSLLARSIPYARRGRATGWVMQAGTLALLGGVPLGGLLAETLGWRAIFVWIGGMALAIVAAVHAWLPADAARAPDAASATLLGGLRRLLARRDARMALAVSLLTWLAMFGLYTYSGAFLAERFAMSPAAIGRTTLALGIGYAIGGQVGGRLGDRLGRGPIIVGGLLIIAAIGLLLPQAASVWAATLLLATLGFGFFFSYSAQLPLISELLPEARSTGMAANYFATYVGAALGAKIGGSIVGWLGFSAVGWVTAGAALLAVVLVTAGGWASRCAQDKRCTRAG